MIDLDDRLARSLTAMAARSQKQLPEWAAEQLTRIAATEEASNFDAYSAEWRAAFGSISDSTFASPPRHLPRSVEPLDTE